MPRHVDADDRRRLVAEAVWRVVLRDGLAAASVRAVAAEAGLSAGAMRHFIPSQADLQREAFERVNVRIGERMRSLPSHDDVRDRIVALVMATMPVDQASREENQIYFAFLERAQVDAELRPVADAAYDETRALCREGVDALAAAGGVADGTDLAQAAAELHAFTDGLAFHAALWPDRLGETEMRTAVERWIDGLA